MSTALPLDARAVMTLADPDHPRYPTQPDPAPARLADTGVAPALLHALLAKHLLAIGAQSLQALAGRMAVHPAIVSELVASLLDAGQIHACTDGAGQLTVDLNSRGTGFARAAQVHDRYVGPAPVSAESYRRLVEANSLFARPLTRSQLRGAFAGVLIDDDTLDQLGHGLNSAGPVLVHGPSGAGKTFLCEQLTNVLNGSTLIPYAVALEDRCVALYDPALHDAIDAPAAAMDPESDPRLLHCRRPALLVGAELQRAALDVTIDPDSGIAQAPLPMRANNGLLVVDDFGRQGISADELMRRLALPIDTHRDWIRLDGAMSAEVPFDAWLVLVTNLQLDQLGTDSFGRRIAHRVAIGQIPAESYIELWRRSCEELGAPFDPALPEYALDTLHARSGIPPLAAHPSALLRHMLEQARYAGNRGPLTTDLLDRAWRECLSAAGTHRTH